MDTWSEYMKTTATDDNTQIKFKKFNIHPKIKQPNVANIEKKQCTWQHNNIIKKINVLVGTINPFHPELFFRRFFGTEPKIGSFRLPTHSRDSHRKFFWWSLLLVKVKIFAKRYHMGTLEGLGFREAMC